MGIMEKKMETTIMGYIGIIGVIELLASSSMGYPHSRERPGAGP